MKKLSLLKIMEGFFSPNTPGPQNAHMFNSTRMKGDPLDNPKSEVMSDEDIDQELALEFSLTRVMRDPRNLPNHNAHNGSFAPGKGSKSFADYQTNSQQGFDDSQEDVMVRTVDKQQSEPGLTIMDDPEIEAALGLQKPKAYSEKAQVAKVRGKEQHWKDARSEKVEPIEENIGTREKGLAYGSPITTKQPFASGMPSITDSAFLSDEDIARELGLMEWMSSTPIFTRRIGRPKSELDFFADNRPLFMLNTEEEFNENQKNTKRSKKKKKISR